MSSYQIGGVFRILAAALALPAIGFGLFFFASVMPEPHWLPFLFGLVLMAFGGFFLKIAWTGRVPSWAEEYGLDDQDEVASLREDMTRKGRFIP